MIMENADDDDDILGYFNNESDYEANVGHVQRYKPKPIEDLVKETRFSKVEIQSLYRGFKQACPSGLINEQMFKEIYQQYFPQGDCSGYAHYLFNTIDQHANGFINFEDFLHTLSTLSRGSIDEKLRWIFNLWDLNSDGELTRDELEIVIESVYDLMGKYTEPPVDEHTSKTHCEFVFERLDVHKRGAINLDEFMRACYNDSSILQSISMVDTII